MLRTDAVLFRYLVERYLFVVAEEIAVDFTVVQCIETVFTEIGVIVLAEDLGRLVAVLLAHYNRVLALAGVDRDLCLHLVQKLGPLGVVDQISVLVDALLVRVISDVD